MKVHKCPCMGKWTQWVSILVLDFFVFPIIFLLLSFQFSKPCFRARRVPIDQNLKILNISILVLTFV